MARPAQDFDFDQILTMLKGQVLIKKPTGAVPFGENLDYVEFQKESCELILPYITQIVNDWKTQLDNDHNDQLNDKIDNSMIPQIKGTTEKERELAHQLKIHNHFLRFSKFRHPDHEQELAKLNRINGKQLADSILKVYQYLHDKY